MEKIVIYTYLAVILIGIGLILFVGIPAVIDELIKASCRKKFTSSLKSALEINPPEWDHVLIIAKRNVLNREQTKIALEKMLHDLITGKSEYSKENIEYIDGLLARILKEEPFEGIPDNLRIHLEHIHTMAEKENFDIQPLANELRELTIKREKDQKFSKIISTLSLIVGVIGAIYGGFSYHEYTQAETIQNPRDPSDLSPNK